MSAPVRPTSTWQSGMGHQTTFPPSRVPTVPRPKDRASWRLTEGPRVDRGNLAAFERVRVPPSTPGSSPAPPTFKSGKPFCTGQNASPSREYTPLLTIRPREYPLWATRGVFLGKGFDGQGGLASAARLPQQALDRTAGRWAGRPVLWFLILMFRQIGSGQVE